MRATLGQLRDGTAGRDGPAGVGGLDRLPALCDAVTAAGAPVTVEVKGEQRPLPTAVDQAAYRILQESLTNVLRHAGQAARATVSLRYEPSALAIRVTDDGRGETETGTQRPGPPGTGPDGPGTAAAGLPAARLVVSPLTAKTHVSRAMTKLAARDRAQLVVIAYEHGLAGPGGPAAPG